MTVSLLQDASRGQPLKANRQSVIRHREAHRRLPDLIELVEEGFVVGDVAHLARMVVVAFESPVGRGG